MAVVSCPVGGLSYTCATINPTFLGCCDVNPCHNGNCPSANLFPMGLGDNFTYVPDHSCPNGGQWWTCAEQTPTFQGCCATDPCNGAGCPALLAAGLGPNASWIAAAAAASQSALESSTAASQLPSCTSQSSESITTSKTSNLAPTSSSTITNATAGANLTIIFNGPRALFASVTPFAHPSNTRAITGGAVAGIAVLALIGALIFYPMRRRNKPSIQYAYEGVPPARPTGNPQGPAYKDNPAATPEDPPYEDKTLPAAAYVNDLESRLLSEVGLSDLQHSAAPRFELPNEDVGDGNQESERQRLSQVSPHFMPSTVLGAWV